MLMEETAMVKLTPILLLMFVATSCAMPQDVKKAIDDLEYRFGLITKQIMMQQLAFEERVRSEGSSGIKQNRINPVGTRNYFVESHTGDRFAALHNHADWFGTLGMGEATVVLNGVEFRIRHSDYKMNKPVKSYKVFKKVEPIKYPGIPQEVLDKPTLDLQMEEMREWFKAWKDSDTLIRDYRKYFKPLLCYLEGYWSQPIGKKIEEPFQSDRHKIDAATWDELIQKIRYSAYSGRPDAGQNFAFLPTKIMELKDNFPIFAQWNYRMLCHPLKQEVPLHAFRLVDDLSARLKNKKTVEQHKISRAARFQLNPRQKGNAKIKFEDESHHSAFMDKLMAEVPGLSNYEATFVDDSFGEAAYPPGAKSKTSSAKLNVGYYNRYFKEFKKGALGTNVRKRAYADHGIYMAMTDQPEVAPIKVRLCTDDNTEDTNKNRKCKDVTQRWSYAIPLEIVYMTPLQTWNPYKIPVYDRKKHKAQADRVDEGGRDGTPGKPFRGARDNLYYITPKKFYKGDEHGKSDPADSAKNFVMIEDPSGTERKLSPSGMRIVLPEIEGVGFVRQRWPVAPVHGEGTPVWKEVDALKDVVMNSPKYCKYFYSAPASCMPKPLIFG